MLVHSIESDLKTLTLRKLGSYYKLPQLNLHNLLSAAKKISSHEGNSAIDSASKTRFFIKIKLLLEYLIEYGSKSTTHDVKKDDEQCEQFFK